MARAGKPTIRQPATKLPHLQKKIAKNNLAGQQQSRGGKIRTGQKRGK